MASSDWISQLAKKPPAYKAGVLFGVMAVLGLFYYQFRYSSLADERNSAERQHNALRQTNQKLKKDKQRWEELILQKDRLDEKLKKIKVSLPASSELPAFFLHLQKQAAAAGVNLKNWKRLKEKPVASYVRVPVQIEVTGTFYQINHYFYLLHETERIITVENFSLGKPTLQGGEVVLTADFTASTFRQADAPPDTSFPDPRKKKEKGGGEGKGDKKQGGSGASK